VTIVLLAVIAGLIVGAFVAECALCRRSRGDAGTSDQKTA
jgi:hypothetical protein